MPYHILYQEAAGRITPRRINRLSSLYKELLLRGHFSNLFEPLRPHAWTQNCMMTDGDQDFLGNNTKK